MVGISDLMALSRSLDPVTTIVVGAAILLYIRRVIEPRLSDVEQEVDDREDRMDDRDLSNKERDLLIDDNAEKVGQLDDAHSRLKKRVRRLEQAWAAEHGRNPGGNLPNERAADVDRDPGGYPDTDSTDGDDDRTDGDGADSSDADGDDDPDAMFDAAADRLRTRVDDLMHGRDRANKYTNGGIPERIRRPKRRNTPPRGDD